MGILNNLRAKVQTVSDGLETGATIRDILLPLATDILDLQKQQLFAGQASSGEDIRPYYSEDLKPRGYFHSAESAKRYAAWKETGINYPYTAQRNPDAPNLYINGRFHDELGIQFDVATLAIIGTTMYSKGIVAKYGMATFGLTSANWMVVFIQKGAYNNLMKSIKNTLYG